MLWFMSNLVNADFQRSHIVALLIASLKKQQQQNERKTTNCQAVKLFCSDGMLAKQKPGKTGFGNHN